MLLLKSSTGIACIVTETATLQTLAFPVGYHRCMRTNTACCTKSFSSSKEHSENIERTTTCRTQTLLVTFFCCFFSSSGGWEKMKLTLPTVYCYKPPKQTFHKKTPARRPARHEALTTATHATRQHQSNPLRIVKLIPPKF